MKLGSSDIENAFVLLVLPFDNKGNESTLFPKGFLYPL